ncbi:AraC family transcriptional regulator [Myxococcus sp. AS-1-15]|uniref:helix-turn-helix domain-containing protein n=1 Tax=Myxococcus sp. AS-1-15 TaxID=2874600 RepID=UPI001CBDE58C|nr:helix-turn-helix domain-containing protein [Myxococcus sp. AS-1-15]
MHAGLVHRHHIAPGASVASAVAALFVDERDHDVRGLLIPRPEVHLVVRFGPAARRGLDAHAMGGMQRVRRKQIHHGQRTVTARLHLGAHEAVLGVPASALAGSIVALEDLWGDAAARRLFERLGDTDDTAQAADILERAIAERLARTNGRRAHPRLALDAAERLSSGTVNDVAGDIGVSDRHLRRVFRETVGVGPKAFARLVRFHRALRAASEDEHAPWADIAADAGYYDQAHLIAEFRAFTGLTPQGFLRELRATELIS